MQAKNVRVLSGKFSVYNFIYFIRSYDQCILSERSKSALAEEILSDAPRNYPLRRQSAIVDFKPKVSKWTKVKAAFKWEKANALPDDIHSASSTKATGLGVKAKEISPVNTEVARYCSLIVTEILTSFYLVSFEVISLIFLYQKTILGAILTSLLVPFLTY